MFVAVVLIVGAIMTLALIGFVVVVVAADKRKNTYLNESARTAFAQLYGADNPWVPASRHRTGWPRIRQPQSAVPDRMIRRVPDADLYDRRHESEAESKPDPARRQSDPALRT